MLSTKAPNKLTAKRSCEIRPGAWVNVEVNEPICIPKDHFGFMQIRKSLFNKQLIMGANGVEGGEEYICAVQLHNAGSQTVEIRAGEELVGMVYCKRAFYNYMDELCDNVRT